MRLRLSQQGLLLILLPLAWQVCLVAGLLMIGLATSDYIQRCEHTAMQTQAYARWAIANCELDTRVDIARESHLRPDKSLLSYLAEMRNDCNYMMSVDQKYANYRNHSNSLWVRTYESRFQWGLPEFRNGTLVFASKPRKKDAISTSDTPFYFALLARTQGVINALTGRAPAADQRVIAIDLGEHPDGHQSFVFTSEYRLNERRCWTVLLIVASAINLALIIVLGVFLHRRIVKRLNSMQENVRRMAKGEQLKPPLSGHDEIAQLDRTFHTMASAINEATGLQRGMMESASDLICFLNHNGRILNANRAASDILGYQSEELTGRWIADIVSPRDQSVLADKLQAAIKDESAPFELQLKRRDGSLAETLWSVKQSDMKKTLFCVVHDISAKKAIERLQTEVVQMVGHDLRSPLFAISGFHEMLDQGLLGSLGPQAKALLETAQRSTNRLIQLINDLLDVERIDSKRLVLQKQTIQLSQLFDEAIASVMPLAEKKGVSVSRPATNLSLVADEQRLLQVLVNLLANAIKFTPAGKQVTLAAETGYDCVRIDVIDQGSGIPAEMINHIFERFFQLKTDGDRTERGTGLGLAICKALVELHGGDISVHSEEEVGTTFSVRIPVSDELGNTINAGAATIPK